MSSHISLPKDRQDKSKLFVTLSSLDQTSQQHNAEYTKCIETHPFNHRCDIFAPRNMPLESLVNKYIGWYYRVKLRLVDLIDPTFISTYIKPSQVLALSTDQNIDSGNVYAIDGQQGTLILSVDKDTYEELGLTGKPAKFPLDRGSRFIIKVDLKADCMAPEKKYFQRLHQRFSAVLNDEIEFIMGCYDPETGQSRSLDELPGATKYDPAVRKSKTGELLPQVSDLFEEVHASQKPSEQWIERALEVYEYIGLMTMGMPPIQSNVSEYSAPPASKASDGIQRVSITGLLPPRAISRIAQDITTATAPEFLLLCVWGHDDAPVSWGTNEHYYLTSGEHMYAQLYQPQDKRCVTYQACGPWDTYT